MSDATLKTGPPAWLQAGPFAAVFGFFFVVTLLLGFAIAYFLAFHVRGPAMQTLLFVVCTI